MRLDHLLSKEHHEKAFASGEGRAVKESCAVVAPAGCATTIVFFKTGKAAGTLLGPETTLGLFRVVSPRLGGGVWCLICG